MLVTQRRGLAGERPKRVQPPGTARMKLLELTPEAIELVAGWLCPHDFASFARVGRGSHTAAARVSVEHVAGREIVRLLTGKRFVRATLCEKCPNVMLPLSVDHIVDVAFMDCESLLSVQAPGVLRVGDSAFHYCRGLKSVHLPGLVALQQQAFIGCTSLTTVDLPASVSAIPNSAFTLCVNLTTISIPGVREISAAAFAACRELTTVSSPSELVTIGNEAFSNCESLVSIDFSDSLAKIGDRAFEGCKSIDNAMRARVVAINPRAI